MKGLIIINAFAKEANQLNQPLRLKEEFEKIGVEADIRVRNFGRRNRREIYRL